MVGEEALVDRPVIRLRADIDVDYRGGEEPVERQAFGHVDAGCTAADILVKLLLLLAYIWRR